MGGGDTKTVFIRYSPALSTLTRHHLEAICSEVGPVKKCSLIRRRDNNNNNSSREDQFRNNNTEALGYAFVKFLSNEDALEAIEKLNKKNVQFNQITGELKVLSGGASKKNIKGAEGVSILTFLVELGRDANSKAADTNKSTKSEKKKDVAEKIADKDQQAQDDDKDEELTILQKRKRNARLIIRNLSFYANEKDIRKFMEKQFGPLLEVTLPLVRTPGSGKAQTQHRGFAFVTFENPLDAHKAVNFKGDLIIRKRKVNVSFSVSKAMHTQQKHEEEKKEKKVNDDENGMNDEESSDSNSSDDDGSKSSSDTDSESDSDSDDDDDDDESISDEDETDESSDKEDEEEEEEQKVDPAILQKRSLFLRNLPYDVTRHDIFELFSPYGYVSKIYIVKDYDTGVPKGTAFVEYKESSSAEKAMKAASPDLDIGVDEDNDDNNSYNEEDNNEGRKKSFSLNQNENDTKRSTSQQNQNSIFLINGRQIFVNYAVDKNTANTLTLTSSEHKESKAVKIGKDKRNLYLKNEGRVTEQDGWDDLLPESDKEKRGRAHNEKSQKLRSPIFFINPFRLSIRNLSKHIQKDSQLRQLIIEGVQRGLDRNVVSKQDLWLHERAKGEAKVTDENQRKVLGRNEMLQMEVPEFDTKTLKKYIPSVHIEKDPISQNSKGFGFVEFSHHAHALACLRELNNNPRYTGEHVAGGKRALIAQEQGKRGGKKKKKNTDGEDDDKTKIPRLIVEFTVENKVKARLQAEKRARQLKNMEENPKKRKVKQKKNDDDDDNTENPPKQSRGAKQREKKRKRKEMELLEKGGTSGTNKGKKSNTFSNSNSDTAFNNNKSKNKTMKPPKKQKKLDKEEQAFDDMVRSYKASFASASTTSSLKSIDTKQTKSREKPRWFD